MRTVATRTILGVALQMAGPSLAGSDLAGDRSDVIAEGDRAGHHWQQGQWFDCPLAYRTPRPAAVDVPLVTDRHAMALALAAASERTGYARDGACDPASLEEVEATMAFAFRLTDRMPADHDLHFDPDFMSDGGVVGAEIVWAGSSPPSPDAVRRFLVLADRIGPPARVGAGRLAPFEDIALILPDDPADYRIYEKAGALSAALRRNVADEERGGTVPQPPCDGPIWDEVANTVLHLRFPEGVTRSKEDRLAAAAPAFELVARLRSSP